tara:strand:- start:59 stop:403 length:345 start_codon:yes stop_codon:yes gene_type:complete
MNLYTDGTTQATTEDLAAAAAVDYAAAREATASEIQETIDDDSNLTSAEIVASADGIDKQWVAVTLPADDGTPKFWESQVGQMVINGGQDLGSNKVRMRKDKMEKELSRISALL